MTPTPPVPFALRPAEPRDLDAIVGLIRELAEFERLTHLLQVTPQTLEPHLFGARPVVEALVAEREGAVVAFALFFTNFSTFLGKPGLYLEDLFVYPQYRGRGLGRQLLRHLARVAVARDYGRVEWSVLDWNVDAIGFYRSIGAELLDDWRRCRLAGDAIPALANA